MVPFIECLLLCSLLCEVTIVDSADLVINQRDRFPHSIYELFSINIVSTNRNAAVSDSLYDALIIVIRSASELQNELERFSFDYGHIPQIDDIMNGDYVTIPRWEITNRSRAVVINVRFKRKAHLQRIELYQLAASTLVERSRKYWKMDQCKLLFSDIVRLLMPPLISLIIRSDDGRNGELMPLQKGIATCRAFDGNPLPKPEFTGEIYFEKSTFNEERNERRGQFLASITDHKRRLGCRAGVSETNRVVLILHHPTEVMIVPEIKSFLGNGRSVICTKADGYPSPIIQWNFIFGPVRASNYFDISNDGATLRLHGDAPIGSMWSFNCSASNPIPGSVMTYNRTVSFYVFLEG